MESVGKGAQKGKVSESQKGQSPSDSRHTLPVPGSPGFSQFLSCMLGCLHKRTLELIFIEEQLLQARQIPD